jgi:hypothetical protein
MLNNGVNDRPIPPPNPPLRRPTIKAVIIMMGDIVSMAVLSPNY